MALVDFTEDVEVIQKLGTFPNAEDGLTAEDLKKKFDEAPAAIKKYLNETLIPEARKLREDVDALDVVYIALHANADGSYSTSAQAADILAAYRSGRELCCVVPVNGQQVMLPLLSAQEDGTRLVCTFGGTGAWLTGDEVCTVSAWLEVSGGMVAVKVQEASAGHASAIGRVSREYETNDYLVALTYHTQGSDVQNNAKMLMYLSANGVDFRKVAAMPIDFDKKIYDLSTICFNDMWVIAFDCIDYEYNEWTQENSKYNRGGNRVGIITTTDFIEFKQVYVELPLEWKSTWAPELFVVDDKLHMIVTTSTCTVTRDTASGGKTYVKDGIYICRLNDDFTLESYQQITLPDDGIAPDNYIDGFIYQADGVFYLGIKEETNKKQRIYKSDDLYGDYTLVHEFEEQVEGLSIVKFNDRYFAYSDKYVSGGFYQEKGTAISVSSDLQTWSGHAMANVDGDAWNRHFTPFVVSTPEQKQSIDSLLKSFGPVDAPLDTWSKKSYCVAAGTGKYTIERLLIQPNAVYYISGGADLTINFMDTSLMNHGDTCKFIISSMASNAKITFKYNEGNTLFWGNLEDLVFAKSNGVLTVTCGNGVANKYCFAEVSASSGTDYILPVATPNRLGGVKPVEATDEMTQPVGVTQDGKLVTAPGGGSGGITPPATAEIGQTIVVKSVDENGKPTQWEAADLPVGGGGDGGFDEVLIDFTTEETVSEFQVPIPHEFDSVLKNASEHFMYLYIPRNTEDTATSTVGKVSIYLTTGWKQVLFSGLVAIPAPTETWTKEGCVLAFLRTYKTGVYNIDKQTVTQCDCVSTIVNRNMTMKRITGALELQPFVQLYTTNYFTVEGTQEMYKGTRFILGVRR